MQILGAIAVPVFGLPVHVQPGEAVESKLTARTRSGHVQRRILSALENSVLLKTLGKLINYQIPLESCCYIDAQILHRLFICSVHFHIRDGSREFKFPTHQGCLSPTVVTSNSCSR
jgi:hypothetical protein